MITNKTNIFNLFEIIQKNTIEQDASVPGKVNFIIKNALNQKLMIIKNDKKFPDLLQIFIINNDSENLYTTYTGKYVEEIKKEIYTNLRNQVSIKTAGYAIYNSALNRI
ncbi:MAG: hypothetical protein MJ187_01165 [Alphaproteobacteria bacterium]|nr:hypothetical protein [Alphaproteobacteria bacterium]